MEEEPRGVTPLYAIHSEMGLEDSDRLTPYALCKEVMKIIDRKYIEGAQKIRNLWRIYINDQDAKESLESAGLSVQGISVPLYKDNPFIRNEDRDNSGRKKIKIVIQNLPLSIANKEIETMLSSMNCPMLGPLEYDFEMLHMCGLDGSK